ncbi:hypothetical protein R5R35_005762 [Gryllus longicercus]|uniref:Nucleoprotein TPR n=1 Tax=Gryllus longicercus TaxID=2509291 RepID=A0AAN9ZIR1_9ORTH
MASTGLVESALCPQVLTTEEYESISDNVRCKIEAFVKNLSEDRIVSKALLETTRLNSEQAVSALELKVGEKELECKELNTKLEATIKELDDIKGKWQELQSETSTLKDQINRLEAENNAFRLQRNAAVDERDDLLKIVERRNAELNHLQEDYRSLSSQLQTAIAAKCEALVKSEEVETQRLNLEFKEKRMEGERERTSREIESLTTEVNRLTEEIMNMRRENTTRRLTLEAQLNEKTEELKISQQTLDGLQQSNILLEEKLEDSLRKLMAEHETINKLQKTFEEELMQQTKLAELYKGMNEDATAKSEKLESGIRELQDLLRSAAEESEKTEVKIRMLEEDHERKLAEKDECIENLRKELKSANDLVDVVREDKKMEMIEELSPAAANIIHLFNSRMTLTQIYMEMKNMSQELIKEKQENKRLNDYLDDIVQQIEKKAPELQKLRDDHSSLLSDREQLCATLDIIAKESEVLNEEIKGVKKLKDQLERENERLKKELVDLSTQVCFLLKENQEIRANQQCVRVKSENQIDDIPEIISASEVISKHLVTFSNIQELQSTNKKLLSLVRELSEKAEKEEMQVEGKESYEEIKTLLEIRTKELDETKERLSRYSKMMEKAMQQMEYFKNKIHREGSITDSRIEEDTSNTKSPEKLGLISNSSAASCDIHEEEIKELTEKFRKSEKDLQELQEEFDMYRTERQTNECALTEQVDAMREELRNLRMNCSKMTSQLEYSEERFKIMQANCNTYKTQIAALEGKNKNYSNTIVKQEQTLAFLQDELFNTQNKLSKSEVSCENYKRDLSILRETEARLVREREIFQREQHTQSAVLANLDTLRVSLERTEVESRARLESRLDESLRECGALRRRLQEEQDRFRELSNHLERQMETAKTRVEEEKQLATRYKEELDAAKDELTKAKCVVDDLNKRVGDKEPTILRVEKKDVEVTTLEKQARELQAKIRCLEIDLNGTQEQLTVEKEHSKQFAEVSESLEVKLSEIAEEYNNYKITAEKRIAEFMQTEEEHMKKVSALESRLSSLQTGSNQSSAQLSIQLQKTQEDLRIAQEELDKAKHDLTNARVEVASLSATAQSAEDKYAHEIVMHSTDLQTLLTVKKELAEVSAEVKELRGAKANAEQALEQGKESWEERESKLLEELTETQKRITDLDSHNAKLHEQLEELSSKVAIIQAQGVQPSPNTSFSEDPGNKCVNTSFSEDEIKSTDQLMQIIKYLRKEKNVAINRYDVLRAENMRLSSQLECIKKQLDDAKNALNAEKEKSDVTVLTTSKHSELLRKLETLSAITDSNRMLRSERDGLQAQVKELQLRVDSLEQELGPMREQNRDLTARVDALDAENIALRNEAGRLRQRVNFLIERSSKTSPEDWRRLQQERESLARQVSADREALQRKDEEARVLRQEKARLEEQINTMTRQQQQQAEEMKRQAEELNAIQQRLSRVTQELGESKMLCNKKNEELAKITEDLGAKEAMLTDARNKEFQIRKIAKKYKTQWEELTKTSEEDKKKIEELNKSLSDANAAASSAAAEITQETQEQLREEGRREVEMRIAEAENRHSDRVKELVGQVTSSHEEAETLRKENDSLRNSANEKEERAKQVLKNARQKIMQLTESRSALMVELEETKSRLQLAEQGKEDSVRLSALKSQYENRITHMEKENADLRAEKQHEMEALNQRISQLQRQLEKFQGSKPSTSSGSGDKAGGEPPTANIKPMAGPSSTGVKQTQSQQSVTVTPWAGRGDTPFASIRPMSMQSRTAAVLPTSQSASSTLSPATPVLVPPQQQLVHTTGSSSGSGPEGLSSSPTSSHTDYIPTPATSSASSGSSVVRQVAVPPTVTTVTPSSREEPPQTAQNVAESTQDMEAEPAVSDATPQTGTSPQQQQQQQLRQQPDHVSQHKVEPQLQQQQVQPPPQPTQQPQPPQQQQPQALPQSQPTAGTSQQLTQALAPSAPQQGQQAVAMVLPRVEQPATVPPLSGQGQQVEQAAAAPSSQASSSSNTVTTSQAGVGGKRAREAESEGVDEDSKAQGKRSRLAGQQDMFPASSDSVLEVEYQVPTSSQRDQEDEMVDSEEDEEGIADEGVIEEPDAGHEFEDEDNEDGYAVQGYRDDQDLTSFEEVEGPDIDEENPADQENNEAEIMDDSNEVPNQSGTDSPARPAGEPTSRPPTAPQQHAEASSSGTSTGGGTEVGSACATGVGTSRVASSVMGFGRGPARSVPPLSRQQQQNQILLGYEESGDDSIVPSTPTLFVPRRSDGFGEAVSSPQVPQTRFTFSDANPPATRTVSQGTSENMDDNRMDLNQLEEAGTGRSVPTTPPQVSPQEMSSEVGQSEGGSEEVLQPSEVLPEASGSQTTVPSITVTEASEDDTGDAGEEMPPPEISEYDESTEQRDTSTEQEQEENLELADEGGDGVSSEGEKSQPLEDVEEGREAEATEAGDAQDSPRRVTRAANIARRSARAPYRNQRGRGSMRPTPIVWNEPGSSMGSQLPRGRAIMMRGSPNDPMRGNFTRGNPRNRRPRGKPKGNFNPPYQMRF